ncbi:hypothetical protein [Emcibacter sp. SYSU 3D8]|uniref:YsaB family lipoprotein n=1 Tax=Emcibacter sp. SYSU 3D8 TaxID=3133969 RepID=UPI0031FE8B08
MAAASAASAAPVAASNMGAYCRSQAAKEFSARPSYVKSTRAMPAEDGSATVNGTYADGNGHTKAFTCRFDAQGNFVEVKAADTGKP